MYAIVVTGKVEFVRSSTVTTFIGLSYKKVFAKTLTRSGMTFCSCLF